MNIVSPSEIGVELKPVAGMISLLTATIQNLISLFLTCFLGPSVN